MPDEKFVKDPELEQFLASHAERYDKVLRMQPKCPKCTSPQLQVLNLEAPAIWRCRKCKHKFQYEPL